MAIMVKKRRPGTTKAGSAKKGRVFNKQRLGGPAKAMSTSDMTGYRGKMKTKLRNQRPK